MSRVSKFVFVILHYIAVDETIACVKSIQKYCSTADYEIIIVDNCSPNESGPVLKKMYEQNHKITVLLHTVNDGYARGNNVGIQYAQEHFKSSFLIVLNNDIQLSDARFCEQIELEYTQTKFALLGPKIILPSGLTEQYPFEAISRKQLLTQMTMNIVRLCLLYGGLYQVLYSMRRGRGSNAIQKPEKLLRHEDVVLHGSCMIFSTIFFEYFDGFDPRTFMYKEEQLLYRHLQRKGLKIVYNPDIVVLHNEGASTSTATSTPTKKLIFLYKNQLRSSVVLLKELDK